MYDTHDISTYRYIPSKIIDRYCAFCTDPTHNANMFLMPLCGMVQSHMCKCAFRIQTCFVDTYAVSKLQFRHKLRRISVPNSRTFYQEMNFFAFVRESFGQKELNWDKYSAWHNAPEFLFHEIFLRNFFFLYTNLNISFHNFFYWI